MPSHAEPSTILDALRAAEVPSVADGLLQYGLAVCPEYSSELIDAALAGVERDATLAMAVFTTLANRTDIAAGHPSLSKRTRALASALSPRALVAAAEVIARTEGDASLDFIVGILDGPDEVRSVAVVGALMHLSDGTHLLAERLSRTPRPSIPVTVVVAVLLGGPAWTRSTLRLVLEVAAEQDERGGYRGVEALIDEINATSHPCASIHNTLESWAEAVHAECSAIVDMHVALRVVDLLEDGDAAGALRRMVECVPQDWLAESGRAGEPSDIDLAAGILAVLSEDLGLSARFAEAYCDDACRLVAGCVARIIDERDGPEGDPAAASLDDALSAIASTRTTIPRERAWIERVASFGDRAAPELGRRLRSDSIGEADRAAEALARIGTEEAVRVLVASVTDDTDGRGSAAIALGDVPRAVLAQIDRELLARAVTAADWDAAAEVLERWHDADAQAIELEPPVLDGFERLAFAEEARGPLTEFVMANPLPAFVDPVLSVWRPGDEAVGRAARVLLSIHRPGDPCLAEIARDLESMTGETRIKDMAEGRLFVFPLSCRCCGALYSYDVRQLQLCLGAASRTGDVQPRDFLVIGDTIRCKRCGSVGTHEWTRQAEQAFTFVSTAQALHAQMAGEEETMDLLRRGAVSPMKFTSTVGDDLPFGELVARLEERVRRAPDDPAPRIRFGNAKLTLGRLDEAAAVYTDILARWPNHAEAAYQLGNTLERQERLSEALEAFVRLAKSLASSEPDAAKYAASLTVSIRDVAKAAGVKPPTDVLDKLSRLRASAPTEREKPVRSPPRLGRGASLDLEDEDYLEMEDDFEVVRPVRRERPPGRNDPCPCGSGKKYKKCCERKQTRPSSPSPPPPPSPQGSRARRIAQRLTERVMSAAKRLLTKEEFRRALGAWKGVPATSDVLVTDDEAEMIRFNEYLLHDWRPDGGATLVERFQKAEGTKLTAEERAQVNAWLTKRRRGWFEVDKVDASGALTTLRDCIEGDTCVAYDVALSSQASRGDMFILAVFPVGSRLEISATATNLRRDLRTAFDAWLRREHDSWSALRVAAVRSTSWRAFFSDRAAEIEREVMRLAELPPRLILSTGESPTPGHAVYEVKDRQAVLATLESTAPLVYRGWSKGDSIEGDSYGWVHRKGDPALPFERPVDAPGDDERPQLVVGAYLREQAVDGLPMPGETIEEDIAVVYLGTDRMEVQALSSERLDYARRALEERLGSAIREKYVKCEGPDFAEELWSGARSRGGAPEARPRRDSESHQLEREFFARSADRWVDGAIPVLGGTTPRQAVADPQMRGEVEAMLRDFEEHERRGPASGRGFAARIRKELGMQ